MAGLKVGSMVQCSVKAESWADLMVKKKAVMTKTAVMTMKAVMLASQILMDDIVRLHLKPKRTYRLPLE